MDRTLAKRFAKLMEADGLNQEEIEKALKGESNFEPKALERHPTLDLFVCPSLIDISPKSDMASLEHPFFVLSGGTSREVLHYEHETRHGVQSVHITPSYYGLPTIRDKDLLIFAMSHLLKAANDGKRMSKTVRFGIYDFIVTTNRSKGKTYSELERMLSRLRGCSVRTSIRTGNVTDTHEFGMIDGWRTEKHDNSLKGQVEITLSDFLMRALVHREVLTLTRDYFLISSNLKRRCYELARKHLGKQKYWSITLALLHKKSGSGTKSMSKFRQQVKEIAADNDIPDYTMVYSRRKDKVVFLSR